jgi:hypothetical protein
MPGVKRRVVAARRVVKAALSSLCCISSPPASISMYLLLLLSNLALAEGWGFVAEGLCLTLAVGCSNSSQSRNISLNVMTVAHSGGCVRSVGSLWDAARKQTVEKLRRLQ